MDTCQPNDSIYEDVATILSGAQQMSNLITAMVDWTAVNSAADAYREPTNVVALCTQAVRAPMVNALLLPLVCLHCRCIAITSMPVHVCGCADVRLYSYGCACSRGIAANSSW